MENVKNNNIVENAEQNFFEQTNKDYNEDAKEENKSIENNNIETDNGKDSKENKKEEQNKGENKEEHKDSKKKGKGIKDLTHNELLKEYEKILKENEKLKSTIHEKENIIQEKEKLIAEYLDKYKRSLAEMENLRKRTIIEKQESLKYANFNIISDLLIILDDFQRAIDSGKNGVSDINVYIQGIEMIERQFIDLMFKKYGVVKYGQKGDEFNPNLHHAMMMEEGDYEKEIIIELFRSGYMLHDRVIRPAQVKVGKPKN